MVPKQGRKLDKPAGTVNIYGYTNIRVNGKLYPAHRLAWFYMTGTWPRAYIDHKDGEPRNNKWNNLREATAHQNAANKRRKRGSASGVKGVIYNRFLDTWDVHISCKGRVYSYGPYYSVTSAWRAHAKYSQILFGEFSRSDPALPPAKFNQNDVDQAVKEFDFDNKV